MKITQVMRVKIILHFSFYISLRLVVDADALQIPLLEAMNTLINFNLVMPTQFMKFGWVGQLL